MLICDSLTDTIYADNDSVSQLLINVSAWHVCTVDYWTALELLMLLLKSI